MRLFTLAVICMLGMSITAQKQKDLYDTFLRVYDHSGKKIAKGNPTSITHNTLHLRRGEKGMGVNYKNIGKIKTKKSRGHSILVSSIIGLTTSAIAGAIMTEPGTLLSPDTKGEGALAAAFFGTPTGAAIGTIGGFAKREETIYINGNLEDWKLFVARFPGTNPNGLLSMVDD